MINLGHYDDINGLILHLFIGFLHSVIKISLLFYLQEPEAGVGCDERIQAASPDTGRKETDPLLNKEVVMTVNDIGDWPRKSCIPIQSAQTFRSRQTVLFIATIAVCFAVCAVLYHPNKVTQLAVSIRTRLAHKL